MTWAQILKRARRIGQQYEAGGYWTPEEWLVVANQVQTEIIQQTEGILVHDSSKTTTASVSYIEIPNTFLNIQEVYCDNKPLTYKKPWQISAIDPDWKKASEGTPLYIWQEGQNLYFWPTPDSAYDLILYGTKKPADMTGDDSIPYDDISTLYSYHINIVLGLIANMFSDMDKKEQVLWLTKYEDAKIRMFRELQEGAPSSGLSFPPEEKVFTSEV